MENNEEINIIDFLKEAVQQSVEIYQNQVNNILQKLSEVNVHDFRVCIRRLLAQSNLIHQAIPFQHHLKLKAELKSQGKIFNDLRDIQVQILKTQNLVYELPALYKFYHYLIDQEYHKVDELKQNIKQINYNESVELFSSILKYLNTHISLNFIKTLISDKLKTVLERHKIADKTDLATIHKTRLAFKKFRYSVEFLFPILNYDLQRMKQLKVFQTRMGLIQDNVVYYNHLLDWQSSYKELTQKEFKEIKSKIFKERANLIEDYFHNFNEIYTFWDLDENAR